MFPQGASRRLIAAFVLLLLLPAVAVVWLGVRLIVQDRQIELDQRRKQRERAAEQIVNALNGCPRLRGISVPRNHQATMR